MQLANADVAAQVPTELDGHHRGGQRRRKIGGKRMRVPRISLLAAAIASIGTATLGDTTFVGFGIGYTWNR